MISIIRLDHLVINTANVTACTDYYARKMGFRLEEGTNRVTFQSGSQKLNVHAGGDRFWPLASNPTIGHICYGITTAYAGRGLEDLTAGDHEKGIAIIPGMEERKIATDPDGNLILLKERAQQPGLPPIILDQLVLSVSDINASLHFYTSFLGMTAECAGQCAIARGGNLGITLMPEKTNLAAGCRISRGSGDFCVLVDADINAVLDFLVAAHAPFAAGADILRRHGAIGPIDSIYLRDPDGNLVELAARAR